MKRLTPASLTFGVMAIMGLLVAAYVVRSLMAREVKEAVVATRNMPTPVVDIPVGTEITEKHLGTAPIKTDMLTADMLANKNIIIGRVAKEPLKKAEPIKANQLFGPGERPKLELAKGKQAITLPFDSVTTIVDGLIRPGDHCDIRFTVNPSWIRSDQRTSQAFQMSLFKAIKVIAINRNVVQQTPETSGNTVTLEVTNKQANALLLARTYGTLTLTYTQDHTPGGVEIADADADRLTLEKLLGLVPKVDPPAPAKPPEPYRIDEYRALRRGSISFLPNGTVVDSSYNWGGWGNGPILNPNRAIPGRDDIGGGYGTPDAGPTLNAPGAGLPGNSGVNNNGPNSAPGANSGGNNGPTANTNAFNGGGTVPPTQMASQTQYAHQPANNNGANFGPQQQGGATNAGQTQNQPQFYGQSAPGQVTGPGYYVTPGGSTGVYGNAIYTRAN